MPSRSSRDADAKSTKASKAGDGAKRPSKTGEIFQTLAGGILEYSAQKYLSSRQKSSGESSRSKSRRSKTRDGTSDRSPISRHGSSSSTRGEATAILSQIALGLGAFLVRRYMHYRKARKDKVKEEARIREARSGGRSREGDADLRAGLDSLAKETRNTSDSIRNLTGRPPSHPNCDVQGANNIRNLHEDRLRDERGGYRERVERRRTRDRGERRRDGDRDRIQDARREERRRDYARRLEGERPRRAYTRDMERPRSLERMNPTWRRY